MDQVNGSRKGFDGEPLTLREVPVSWLDRVIPVTAEYIRESTKHHPVMELQDIVFMLYRRLASLTVGIQDDEIVGITILSVDQYPRERVCNILGMAAKQGVRAQHWEAVVTYLDKWAADRDCARIVAEGRKGWMKAAKKMGFTVEQRTVLSKELHDARRRREHSHPVGSLERRPAVSAAELPS